MRRSTILVLLCSVGLAHTASAAPPPAAPPARADITPKAPAVLSPKAALPPKAPPTAAPKADAPKADVPSVAAIGHASDFVQRLAPKAGFAYAIDDYQKLDAPTKAVLNTFGKVRNYVVRVAGDHGVGEPVRSENPEVEPKRVTAALDEALEEHGFTSEDAATILRTAAKTRGMAPLMKETLLASAAAWETKGAEVGWKTAVTLKPAAKAPAAPQPSLYEQRITERAMGEWDRAPRARGWGSDRRELVKFASDDPNQQDDIRAFTYEEWMRFRVPQIRENDAIRANRDRMLGRNPFDF